MLPIGGMMTAIFILKKWGVPNFISELSLGMENKNLNQGIFQILFVVSASVVGFILLNEIIAVLTGNPIIG